MDGATIASIVTLGVLAVGAIIGGTKGFARQVIELLGLLVSFFVAAVVASWVAAFLSDHTSLPHAATLVVGFVAVFIGGLVAFHFVAISAQRVIHTTLFGWVDRACGAGLGLIAALLVTSVLANVLIELPISADFERSLDESSVVTFVQPIAGWLFDLVTPRDGGAFAAAHAGRCVLAAASTDRCASCRPCARFARLPACAAEPAMSWSLPGG
jgi:uncharacterized membrane protein required for colicin V production